MVLQDIFLQNARSLGLPLAQASVLEALVAQHNEAQANYERFRKYWNGDHEVRLTDRLKQFLQANGFINKPGTTSWPFSDNFCGVVIAAVTDRLEVKAFTVPAEQGIKDAAGGPDKPGPTATAANDWWAANRGARLAKRVHEHAAALGDAFVVVEYDPLLGRPRFSFNPPELIRVEYDTGDFDRMLRASKRWVVNVPAQPGESVGMVRLNVYYPDRIEKYWSRIQLGGGGTWQQYRERPDDPWPLPWVDPRNGEPLGIPIVHFRNDDRGDQYGRSDIADVIPLQDAVNKALVDGIKIQDAQGWAQRWATGIEKAPSEDLAAQPGSILWMPSVDGKFGQFESADPTKTVAWLELLVAHIAHISQSPQHLFRVQGDMPSGEALKTAEAPLVTKARDRQVVFGNAWEDAMELALRLHNANAGAPVPPGMPAHAELVLPGTGFTVEWASAESRPSELERIQAINAKMGLSSRQRLREYGYEEEEIMRILSEGAEEQGELARIMGQAFDAGQA